MLRRHSITRELVVVSTVASLLLLGGFGLYLDRQFASYQQREYQSQIEAHLRFASSEISGIASPGDPEEEELAEIEDLFDQLNTSDASEPFYVLISSTDGTVRLAMDIPGPLDLADAPFPPPVKNIDAVPSRHWHPSGGGHLILSALQLDTPHGPRVIRSALDWTAEAHQRSDFRRNAILALVVGTVISALGSAVIARRALRPVHSLARAADRIDASRLDEPLEPVPVPLELQGLVRSLGSMQHRLDESFTRLSEFASDLAHEFRTPLNNVMGEISVALAYPRASEEYRDILGSCLEECQRLSRMIEALLFVARADRGAVSLRAVSLDAAAEIRHLVEYYQLSAEDKGIEITVSGNETVQADKDLFRQAIGNLLENAVQYIRVGDRVDVRVRSEAEVVEVCVSDNGPGIPAAELPVVFDRFSRGEQARRMRSDGSGMGLAIVRSIARLHGGDAWIESTAGAGTTVTVSFPAVPNRERERSGTP